MATEIEVPRSTATVVETTEMLPASTSMAEPATHNYRAIQAIWFVTGLVETLIAIRFVLKLLGASTASGFVTFIYALTDGLVAPFRAIFPTTGEASTVDVAAIVALVIYLLIGWGLVALTKMMTTPRGARSVS